MTSIRKLDYTGFATLKAIRHRHLLPQQNQDGDACYQLTDTCLFTSLMERYLGESTHRVKSNHLGEIGLGRTPTSTLSIYKI